MKLQVKLGMLQQLNFISRAEDTLCSELFVNLISERKRRFYLDILRLSFLNLYFCLIFSFIIADRFICCYFPSLRHLLLSLAQHPTILGCQILDKMFNMKLFSNLGGGGQSHQIVQI